MNESWQRRILILAAAWNVVGGIAALVESPQQVAWIAVIAWGAAYLDAALLAAGAADLVFVALFAVIALQPGAHPSSRPLAA